MLLAKFLHLVNESNRLFPGASGTGFSHKARLAMKPLELPPEPSTEFPWATACVRPCGHTSEVRCGCPFSLTALTGTDHPPPPAKLQEHWSSLILRNVGQVSSPQSHRTLPTPLKGWQGEAAGEPGRESRRHFPKAEGLPIPSSS